MPGAQLPQWVILVPLELLRTLTAITNLPIPPLDILRRGVDDDSLAAPHLRYHHATLSFARRLLRPVAAGVSDDCSPLAHELLLVLVLIERRHVVVDATFQAKLVNDDVDECQRTALLELTWVSKECWKDFHLQEGEARTLPTEETSD
jgi:hypothetical protein